jgi:hypothetical protein
MTQADLYEQILDEAEVWLLKAIDCGLSGTTWRKSDQRLSDLLSLAVSLRKVQHAKLAAAPSQEPSCR